MQQHGRTISWIFVDGDVNGRCIDGLNRTAGSESNHELFPVFNDVIIQDVDRETAGRASNSVTRQECQGHTHR